MIQVLAQRYALMPPQEVKQVFQAGKTPSLAGEGAYDRCSPRWLVLLAGGCSGAAVAPHAQEVGHIVWAWLSVLQTAFSPPHLFYAASIVAIEHCQIVSKTLSERSACDHGPFAI
jgi:hypothetical protein